MKLFGVEAGVGVILVILFSVSFGLHEAWARFRWLCVSKEGGAGGLRWAHGLLLVSGLGRGCAWLNSGKHTGGDPPSDASMLWLNFHAHSESDPGPGMQFWVDHDKDVVWELKAAHGTPRAPPAEPKRPRVGVSSFEAGGQVEAIGSCYSSSVSSCTAGQWGLDSVSGSEVQCQPAGFWGYLLGRNEPHLVFSGPIFSHSNLSSTIDWFYSFASGRDRQGAFHAILGYFFWALQEEMSFSCPWVLHLEAFW